MIAEIIIVSVIIVIILFGLLIEKIISIKYFAGIFILIIGTTATIVSYSLAENSSGNYYYIFWGLILWGIGILVSKEDKLEEEKLSWLCEKCDKKFKTKREAEKHEENCKK